VSVFDIFGYFDQTLQGADILANGDDHHKYAVFVPDWFNGEPCPIEWYPPNTEEKQQKLGGFIQKHPAPGVAAKMPAFIRALSARYPSIASWGVIGYCWGGKVVSLVTSGAGNPFAVAAEVHPAAVDPGDAASIGVPLIMLASKEEPAEVVEQFGSALKGPSHVERFEDQIHGWMAARADLSDARVREEYARGYKTVLDFFAKYWN